jgi:hypothetical protein
MSKVVIACLFGAFGADHVGADRCIDRMGYNYYGQCEVPSQNEDFVAIAASGHHSLGLKLGGSIGVGRQ